MKRTELKRKTALRNKAPMPRTGKLRAASFDREKAETLVPAPEPDEHRPHPELRPRKGMRTRGPKMTPIRRAARGEDCTLLIPGVCTNDTATTVLCHSNRLQDGKGMGLKAPDTAACFGCSACHDVLDGRRQLPGWMTRSQLDHVFDRAVTITHARLREKGIQV